MSKLTIYVLETLTTWPSNKQCCCRYLGKPVAKYTPSEQIVPRELQMAESVTYKHSVDQKVQCPFIRSVGISNTQDMPFFNTQNLFSWYSEARHLSCVSHYYPSIVAIYGCPLQVNGLRFMCQTFTLGSPGRTIMPTTKCMSTFDNNRWLNARLWYLQCVSNGDTTESSKYRSFLMVQHSELNWITVNVINHRTFFPSLYTHISNLLVLQ